MNSIPRMFWGKNHGEDWYLQGLKDAMAGKPMQAEKDITRRRWGSLPGSQCWKAYKAGFESVKGESHD